MVGIALVVTDGHEEAKQGGVLRDLPDCICGGLRYGSLLQDAGDAARVFPSLITKGCRVQQFIVEF